MPDHSISIQPSSNLMIKNSFWLYQTLYFFSFVLLAYHHSYVIFPLDFCHVNPLLCRQYSFVLVPFHEKILEPQRISRYFLGIAISLDVTSSACSDSLCSLERLESTASLLCILNTIGVFTFNITKSFFVILHLLKTTCRDSFSNSDRENNTWQTYNKYALLI